MSSGPWRQNRGELPPRYEQFCHLVAGGMMLETAYKTCIAETDSNPRHWSSEGSRLAKKLSWRIREIQTDGCHEPTEATGKIVEKVLDAFRRDAERAREKLWQIIEAKTTTPATKVAALREILDRGLGKPVETTETNLNVRYVITSLTLSNEEWVAKFCRPDRITDTGSSSVN